MLYDPRWEVKADPFSPASLIAWLETMPASRTYNWAKVRYCLLGQWCEYNGLKDEAIIDKSVELSTTSRAGPIHQAALGDLTACTFGAALARARKALGK